MALVNIAFRETDSERFAKIAAEYWTPVRRWSMWEYPCTGVAVVSEEPWPHMISRSAAQAKYVLDREEAKQIS